MLIKDLYQIYPEITEAISLLIGFRDLVFKGIQLCPIDKQERTLGNISILVDLIEQGDNTKSPEFHTEFFLLAQQLIKRLISNYQNQLITTQEGIIWLLAAQSYINKSATRIGNDA